MTDKELDSLCDQIQDQLEMGANAILESIKVKFPNVEFWIRK
jgi:hypothetical protein